MDNSHTGLILLICLFGFSAVLLAYIVIVGSLKQYKSNFIQSIGTDINHLFIARDVRRVFVVHIVVMIALFFMAVIYSGVLLGFVAIACMAAIPGLLLRHMKKRRINLFIYQLPDTLVTMASSLKAGSNLIKTMQQVTEQQPGPVAQEFGIILSEYKMGRSLDDSLMDFSRRMKRQEIELLCSSILISQSLGGNLANTLQTLAVTLRSKAQVEGKIKALTAMGRMQGWMVGLMPIVVMIMLNFQSPETMHSLYSEPVGWMVLSIIAVLMSLAAYMIRKIVNIDI